MAGHGTVPKLSRDADGELPGQGSRIRSREVHVVLFVIVFVEREGKEAVGENNQSDRAVAWWSGQPFAVMTGAGQM